MVLKGIEPIIWVNRSLEDLVVEEIRRVRQIKDNQLKLSLQRVRILMLYIHLVRKLPLKWWTAKIFPCNKGNSSTHKTWITSLMRRLKRSLTAWLRMKILLLRCLHQMQSPNSQDIRARRTQIEVINFKLDKLLQKINQKIRKASTFQWWITTPPLKIW